MQSIIYLSGNSWDAVTGTDKSLAQALAKEKQILWVDPPVSVLRLRDSRRTGERSPLLEKVDGGITRLRTVGPPGLTRPLLRRGTEAIYHRHIRRAVKKLGVQVTGVICSSPIMTFDKRIGGKRLYFVTDDWSSGASLMGFSPGHVARVLRVNGSRADVVAAVSDFLGQSLTEKLGKRVEVLPNGCHVLSLPYAADPGFAKAALVGQLNERLDFTILEAVADTGIYLAVAGPKTAKVPESMARLEAFLDRPNVHWKGVLSSTEVAALLAGSNVGLTPYTDTQFNRSSFPLKTLEYVAAGVSVVATDLPASRFDAAAKVRLARTAEDFAQAVTETAARWPTDAERAEQARQVAEHTWENRAVHVRKLLAC